LLNPWVRSEASLARTQLKHYYLARLMQADFFRKLISGNFNPWVALKGLFSNIRSARGGATASAVEAGRAGNPLVERMALPLQRFKGRILVILSGRDLTAKEFDDAARASPLWKRLYAEARVTRRDLAPADHTFSRRQWRDQVAQWTGEFIAGESWRAARPRSET
jgi:uncharacterized protein